MEVKIANYSVLSNQHYQLNPEFMLQETDKAEITVY